LAGIVAICHGDILKPAHEGTAGAMNRAKNHFTGFFPNRSNGK